MRTLRLIYFIFSKIVQQKMSLFMKNGLKTGKDVEMEGWRQQFSPFEPFFAEACQEAIV